MLSLWNLYPLLLDFVVKVKVKAAGLNATVLVVVEEKQQLGQDPTFSIDNSCNTLSSISRGSENIPDGMRMQQALWKYTRSVDPLEKAESKGKSSGK